MKVLRVLLKVGGTKKFWKNEIQVFNMCHMFLQRMVHDKLQKYG